MKKPRKAKPRAGATVAAHAELTAQQAADLLNVSRPFVVKLLNDGKIPCRTVGGQRRVRFEDLVRYKQQAEIDRRKVLDELAASRSDSGSSTDDRLRVLAASTGTADASGAVAR